MAMDHITITFASVEFITLILFFHSFPRCEECQKMAHVDFWSTFGSAPSVFPPDVEYAIFDPWKLLPEDSYRSKFLITMGLPFGSKTKFFFQILNDESPAGNCS